MIAPYVDARWIKLFDVMGAPEELQDERIADRKGRFFNQDYMMGRVQEYFDKQTTEYWLDALGKADIPAARVNDFPDLQSDPHLVATGFFQRREHPTEGFYWETQPPVTFRGAPQREITPAPRIGEHTELVLSELGLGVD